MLQTQIFKQVIKKQKNLPHWKAFLHRLGGGSYLYVWFAKGGSKTLGNS